MGILVIWIVVAIVGSIIAGNRGRSSGDWFFLCLLCPLAILGLFALPSLKEPPQFEAEALYKGAPYRAKSGGRIEAILPGGDVVFRNMEEFTTAIDGGTIQLKGDERQSPSPRRRNEFAFHSQAVMRSTATQTATRGSLPTWAVNLIWGLVIFFAVFLLGVSLHTPTPGEQQAASLPSDDANPLTVDGQSRRSLTLQNGQFALVPHAPTPCQYDADGYTVSMTGQIDCPMYTPEAWQRKQAEWAQQERDADEAQRRLQAACEQLREAYDGAIPSRDREGCE